MREYFIRLFSGLTQEDHSITATLGEGTVNFYLDGENYLVNYPGRTDSFLRDEADPPVYRGTPPAPSSITRIETFRDVRGDEHIVFVQGAHIREKYGNGYRELYTLKGSNIGGKFYPSLFIHESKLIVVNWGDPPLMWDGIEGVVHLGLQEVMLPPEVYSGRAPHTAGLTSGADGMGYGPWKYRNYWWSGKMPQSGPSLNLGADDTTKVSGYYQVVVQPFDKYGNHGPVSPASNIKRVLPVTTFDAPPDANPTYTDTPTFDTPSFLMADCYPPMAMRNVAGYRWGRTLNMNMDGGAGLEGVYFTEMVAEGTAFSRCTFMKTDGVLASSEQIDTDVRAFAQATFGCSWKGRIFLGGFEDPYIFGWSDQSLFGQTRPENSYRAKDHGRAAVPLGDRLVCITRSSTETLYETNAGSIGILEQNFAHGSNYGGSFIDVGGAIFGLWNDGFGFYDGVKHTFVTTPYYIQGLYIDRRFFVNKALKKGDYYYLSVRKNSSSNENNYLIAFHLKYHQWYIIEENVADITIWKDSILGVDDSIYELFKGTYPEATLRVKGLIPNGSSPLTTRNLLSLKVLMEASSYSDTVYTVTAELTLEEGRVSSGHTIPSRNYADLSNTYPYWDSKTLYSTNPVWSGPRDIWFQVPIEDLTPGYQHTIKMVTPAGHRVRLKGMGVTFGEELQRKS